ncbi:Hypothetical predicted protein, partial [Pelobates cultripes]
MAAESIPPSTEMVVSLGALGAPCGQGNTFCVTYGSRVLTIDTEADYRKHRPLPLHTPTTWQNHMSLHNL